MGIFDFLFGKSLKEQKKDYFFGHVFFKPTGKEIEWHTDGQDSPSVYQKAFVERIQTNYDLVKTESIRLISDEFRNWKEDFLIVNFDLEFTPVFLSISKIVEGQKVAWEIAYESIHDLNHTFTVNFEDWDASSVQIDG